jgi:hypothetical protein
MKLLSAIMLIACVLNARAQQAGISVKHTGGKSVVEFKDSAGKVSKTLDVEAVNPYKTGASARMSGTSGHIYTEGLVSEGNKAGVAIAYHWVVYSEDRVQLQDQGESTLVVYNASGKEVFRKTIDADNAHDPLLSPNGKYVAVSLSGLVHDAPTLRTGFVIYDVATKAVVFERNLRDLMSGVASDDVFVFTEPMGDADNSMMYYVFDSRTASVYSHAYSRSIYPFIKRLENDRVVFLLPPDAERYETYKKHFTLLKP